MIEMEKLAGLLTKLVKAIHLNINEGLADKSLQSTFQPYFRWKIKEFEYSDGGITKSSAEGKELLRPYWGLACWEVFRKISKLSVYKDAFVVISKHYGIEEHLSRHYFESLVTRIAGNILTGKDESLADSNRYVLSFLKDLNDEEQEYRVEVKLRGLVMRPRLIQLDSNIALRKTERRDLEREVPIIFPSTGIFPMAEPTAFLNIKIYTTKAGITIQNEIDRAVAVLRLFKVGAVQDIQHTVDTDSIIRGVVSSTSGRLLGPDIYVIRSEDVKNLKAFWSNMKGIELPGSAIRSAGKEPDELSIAYDRYSDSLEGGILEKRIFSAVMGLEALFLGGGEQQEMSYRLRMRIGKLLSFIGYNASEVNEQIKDAYEIRSKFVHGGLLKQKERQKLEIKYGQLETFSKVVSDYLRASIVTLLSRNSSKKVLVQKIDNCLLDSSKDNTLKESLFIPYRKEALNAAS